MNDLIYHFIITTSHNLSNSIQTNEITWLSAVALLILSALLSILGGAIGGILLAGKDISNPLAARIGGLFGPAGVLPAIFLSLIILKLF